MERLSERFVYYCGLLAEFRENPNINVDDLRHIQNLIDLEEQGLLLKLPCKVGDTIYTIYSDEDGSFIEKLIVEDVSTHRIWIHSMFFDYSDIGKTVFLTQAEAKEVLKRMEERN